MQTVKCKECGTSLKLSNGQTEVTCHSCGSVTTLPILEVDKNTHIVFTNEHTCDVFICCKEMSDNGQKTMEHGVALSIYGELEKNGYRVFYAPISLDGNSDSQRIGTNSRVLDKSKIMIVIGTNSRSFNDSKVKGEWQSFLELMDTDKTKQLIPCYRDMSYDLPEELSVFESFDISRIGFIDYLVKKVSKLISLPIPIENIVEKIDEIPTIETEVTTDEVITPMVDDVVIKALLDSNDKEEVTVSEEKRLETNDIADEASSSNQWYSKSEDNSFNRSYSRRSEDFDVSKILWYFVIAIFVVCFLVMISRPDSYWFGGYSDDYYWTDDNFGYSDDDYEEFYLNYEEEYQLALDLVQKGKSKEAFVIFSKLGDYENSQEEAQRLHNELFKKPILKTISAGSVFSQYNYEAYDVFVGVKKDGNVLSASYFTDVQITEANKWKGIVEVSVGFELLAGLKKDGTVVYESKYDWGFNVNYWQDIVTISVGSTHLVGLKSDGTVVATGSNIFGETDLTGWKDIVRIATGDGITVGIKSDGTVVYAGKNYSLGGEAQYYFDIEGGWHGIIDVSFGDWHVVGLRADGTVVLDGEAAQKQLGVDEWEDIVAISAGGDSVMGLKADGTVLLASEYSLDENLVSSWENIVAISMGVDNAIGLKSNGTVEYAGYDEKTRKEIDEWKNIVVKP